jgi:DNA polymerase
MPRNPTKGDPRRRILPLWNEGDARGLALPAAAQSPAKHRAALALHLEDVADAQALADYNETDIVVEAEASIITPDLEGPELAWWQTHEAINHRGVHVDLEGVANCIAIIEQAYARYNAELHALTGIDAASKVQQLVGWLAAVGVSLPGLDEEQVEAALARTDLLPAARRVLEIRAAVGSASVKKLYAMRNRATLASRLVDLYLYHAARTGRSTGEGPQPTNMPKGHLQLARCGHYEKGKLVPGSGCGRHRTPRIMSCPWCGQLAAPQDAAVTHEWNPEAAEDVLELAKRRSLDLMEHVFGDAFGAIVGSLRGLFDAAPGHDLISSDYNSIEAVGLAMISGEQWRIEVFRTHGKIYETSASMMYRVPFSEFERVKKETGQHHPLRQKGKVGELAFGYQGWLGAAQAFGMPGTEDEIKNDILAWRRASPAVEWLWGGATAGKAFGIVQNALLPDYTGQVGDEHRAVVGRVGRDGKWDRSPYFFGVEGMALLAVKMPGTRCPVLRLDGTPSGIEFEVRGDALYCLLPSNRWLTYHRPRIQPGERGESLSYEGWNSNPKNGATGWIRMNTWGGRLVENIVQGTCRDILAPACIRLEAAGYPVVLHVYDEIVSEVPEGFGSNEEFERIMTERPEWAHDWPVKAPGGWRAKRYRKG